MHICEWNLSVCVCVFQLRQGLRIFILVNVLPPSALYEWECVCACGRRERQREGEHCCSCDEHALWHVPEPGMLGKKGKKEKEGEREGEKKNPLHLPYFKLFSIPPPPPHAISPNSPSSQCVYLFVCILHSGLSTIFLWACCSLLHFLFSHILSFICLALFQNFCVLYHNWMYPPTSLYFCYQWIS